MRSLSELVNADDSGMVVVREWIGRAVWAVEVLGAGERSGEELVKLQVTTRSAMGAVVYETGGILVDGGWVRVLGSGHERLKRTIAGWNEGKGDGFLLVADDAVGGFFAINGGKLGEDVKNVYYFAPDRLEWEPLGMGYSGFLQWVMMGKLDVFYEWIRWEGWEKDVAGLQGDRCFGFYPFLFTVEGKGGAGKRGEISVEEAWGLADGYS